MIEIVRTQIGVLTYLAPIGPLANEEGISALNKIADSCFESHEINLVIDFARVSTITGVVIEALLDIQDKLVEIGGYLKVVNANALIMDIFMVSGFGDYVSIMENS